MKLMKLLHVLFATFISFILCGCNTVPTQATDQGSVIKTNSDGSKIENLSDYALYARQVATTAPIFELTCPDTGCVMKSLKVNAPQGKSDLQPPAPVETAGVAFTKGFFGLAHDVIGLGPWYFGSKVLTKAFDKANSSVTTTTNTTNDSSNRSTDSSNRSTTTTTTTSNTTTDTTTNNSSNNRNCTSGGTGAGGSPGNSGATGSANC